jgi:hypothetical protein
MECSEQKGKKMVKERKQIFNKKRLIAAGYELVNPANTRVHLWVKIMTQGHFLVGKGLIVSNGFAFAANAAYDLRLARAEATAVLMAKPAVKAKVEQIGALIEAARNGEPMVAGFWDSVKSFGKSFYKGVKGVAKKIGKSKIVKTLARAAGGVLKNPMIQRAGAMGLQALGVPLPIAQMGSTMLGNTMGGYLGRFGRARGRRRSSRSRGGRVPVGRYVRRGRRRSSTRRAVSPRQMLSRLGSRHAMSALQSVLPSRFRGASGLGSVVRTLSGGLGGGGLGSIAKSLGIGGEVPPQLCAGYQ